MQKTVVKISIKRKKNILLCYLKNQRDVAQPGLEYWSGGPVVASSNLVIPTAENERLTLGCKSFLLDVVKQW